MGTDGGTWRRGTWGHRGDVGTGDLGMGRGRWGDTGGDMGGTRRQVVAQEGTWGQDTGTDGGMRGGAWGQMGTWRGGRGGTP